MAVNIDLWLSDTTAIDANGRAAAAWNRINDKPTSVAFKKPDGAVLAAQTVRLEYDNNASQSEDVSGETAVRKLIVFGVREHSTVTDTDVAEGYRFIYRNDEYWCVDTILTIGEIQAIFEAKG